MRWEIKTQVPFNSFQYFENTLIAPNGFREYDLRWLLGKGDQSERLSDHGKELWDLFTQGPGNEAGCCRP